MNSKEIVQRTLDFTGPERLAVSFGESDLVWASATTETRATPWRETAPGRWEMTDEWGNLWGRFESTSKGEVLRGVLEDWSDLERLALPDYSSPKDYEAVRRRRVERPDKFLVAAIPGFTFNIARKMRRLETYLCDLLLEPENVRALHDRIDDMLEPLIRNHGAAGADAIMFPEDWGTQLALLIDPALWRREFAPRFERLCSAARESGLRVFMHSCGAIGSIVPDLAAAGVDLLQFDQPRLHGVDHLARFQDECRLTFWCPVDAQKVLPTGDETLIRASARELVEKLWRGRGGFMAGRYPDEPSIGVAPEWQEWACDEFTKRGVAAAFA